MDWWQNGNDYGNKTSGTSSELNIWPIEHPTEPQDEDQPIKCPNPHPSLFNVSNQEERFEGYSRNKEEMVPRTKPVRKRHQRSSTRKDTTPNNPSSVAPPRHSFSARDNLKMFPMFQKFYKNES